MQFPNPIIRSLILYDNNGNAVIILGPGPTFKVINPTSHAELDIDAGTTYPEILFWNSAHTDFGKISLEVNPTSSPNQMMEIRSPAENSLVLPGSPLVQMRLFMSSFLELGNVLPPNSDTSIGGTLFMDETFFSLETRSTASVSRALVQSSASGVGNQDLFIGVERYVIFGNVSNVFGLSGIVYNEFDNELQAWNAGAPLDWTNLTLQNGWTAKAGYYAPAYRFTPTGTIELRGTMTGGTSVDNTVIALMPIVPAKLGTWGGPAVTAGSFALKRLFYNTDGKLYCYGVSGTGDLGLDGARYSYK